MTVNSRGFPVLMVDLSWTLIHKAVQIVLVLLVYKGNSLHPSVLILQFSDRYVLLFLSISLYLSVSLCLSLSLSLSLSLER